MLKKKSHNVYKINQKNIGQLLQFCFTKCTDGPHLLLKLLLLLGLSVLGSGRLPLARVALLALALRRGLAAVREAERRVGSLHGAGVDGRGAVDGGRSRLAHAHGGHGVLEACRGGAQLGCGDQRQKKKNKRSESQCCNPTKKFVAALQKQTRCVCA